MCIVFFWRFPAGGEQGQPPALKIVGFALPRGRKDRGFPRGGLELSREPAGRLAVAVPQRRFRRKRVCKEFVSRMNWVCCGGIGLMGRRFCASSIPLCAPADRRWRTQLSRPDTCRSASRHVRNRPLRRQVARRLAIFEQTQPNHLGAHWRWRRIHCGPA